MVEFDGAQAFPLTWPPGRPRSRFQDRSPFRPTTVEREMNNLEAELDRLGATSPVVSTNIVLRRDGRPYSQQRRIDDPGVAVYFVRSGEHVVLCCDCWDTVSDNLRAIVKHIDAMHGMSRWGVGSLDQAFTAYKALPASTSDPRIEKLQTRTVANGFTPAEEAEAKATIRRLQEAHHG